MKITNFTATLYFENEPTLTEKQLFETWARGGYTCQREEKMPEGWKEQGEEWDEDDIFSGFRGNTFVLLKKACSADLQAVAEACPDYPNLAEADIDDIVWWQCSSCINPGAAWEDIQCTRYEIKLKLRIVDESDNPQIPHNELAATLLGIYQATPFQALWLHSLDMLVGRRDLDVYLEYADSTRANGKLFAYMLAFGSFIRQDGNTLTAWTTGLEHFGHENLWFEEKGVDLDPFKAISFLFETGRMITAGHHYPVGNMMETIDPNGKEPDISCRILQETFRGKPALRLKWLRPQMDDLNQVERIKVKLNLAKNTDSFLEVFGASYHRYRLDAPIDIKEVEFFENNYNISLPKEYKIFLTQIGNGGHEYKSAPAADMGPNGNLGAGPYFGIYKLGDNHQFGMGYVSGPEYLTREPFFNSQITEEEWAEIADNILDLDDDKDEVFERVYAGILTVGDYGVDREYGCGGYAGIMLSGENTGRIVNMYDEIEIECGPYFDKAANFLDWYESWLDKIISGESFRSEKVYTFKEEDLFFGFSGQSRRSEIPYFLENDDDKVQYQKILSLNFIRRFESLSPEYPEYLERLHTIYCTETDETVKLYALNLLVKFDYENMKTELSKLSQTNALEFLKILHLYAKKKISDWQDVIQKLQDETVNPEVTEYIKYVISNYIEKKT